MDKPVNILLCIPLAKFSVDREFFESYVRMKNYLLANGKELPFKLGGVYEYFAHTFPIDANRNECAYKFLESECDVSIWLDTDQSFPDDTLFKLLAHDRPIVAGMYHAKSAPFHPIVFKESKGSNFRLFSPIIEHPEQALFQADMIGMGCVAIKREVFQKLPRPMFKYQEHPQGSNGGDSDWRVENNIADVSEDVWFWKLVKEHTDYPVIIDPTIQCGHIARVTVNNHMFLSYRESTKRQYAAQYGQEALEEKWSQICRAEPIRNGVLQKTSS
jgi:hypothetical protein